MRFLCDKLEAQIIIFEQCLRPLLTRVRYMNCDSTLISISYCRILKKGIELTKKITCEKKNVIIPRSLINSIYFMYIIRQANKHLFEWCWISTTQLTSFSIPPHQLNKKMDQNFIYKDLKFWLTLGSYPKGSFTIYVDKGQGGKGFPNVYTTI